MGPAALPVIGIVLAAGSLGYGVYAGQQAQKAQQNAINQAGQNAQNAQNQQQTQYQQQLDAEKSQTAANLAQEQQTATDTKAAQTSALAQEQAAIGTNSQTLQDSLTNQQAAAFAKQAPIIQSQLQGSGLANGGAASEAYAQYQAGLAANAQSAISNYQIGADQQLNQDTNAATAQQVQAAEANAMTNIGVGEQNMATNFATQGANNQNNAAYQSYLTSLQLGQAQSAQSAANSYTGLAGQVGGGLLQYYGSQNNPAANTAAMQALINQRGTSYGSGSNDASNSGSGFFA